MLIMLPTDLQNVHCLATSDRRGRRSNLGVVWTLGYGRHWILRFYRIYETTYIAASIGTNIALVTASSHSSDIFSVQTGRWITSIYSTTLATNLSATSQCFHILSSAYLLTNSQGLLAYRIWNINRKASLYRNADLLSPVLHVVIESGAIYSATITAALVTFVAQSPGVYVILDMVRTHRFEPTVPYAILTPHYLRYRR